MLNGKSAYAQGVRVNEQSNRNRFAHSQSGHQGLLSRVLRKWSAPFLGGLGWSTKNIEAVVSACLI